MSELPAIDGASTGSYDTLYTGSKHFWKARCHVDFTINWHKEKHVIEIALFNVDLHQEGERIFVDPELLFAFVDKEEVEGKVRARQEEMMRMRKPRILSEELAKAITAQMAVQVIIQRATVETTTSADVPFKVVIAPQTGDATIVGDKHTIAFIVPRPEGFVDTEITRKKKSSSAEFRQTLLSLKADSRKLTNECNKAARKAGLAKSACAAFVNNKARYTYDPERMSQAKIRFLKAGRRIIALNCVRKITALLERIERKSMGDFPSPTAAEFADEQDFFPSLTGSPSLPNLDSLVLHANGRRSTRPHRRLRPVRRANPNKSRLAPTTESAAEEEDASQKALGASQSSATISAV